MSVDDFVKILLAVAFSISLVGISFQLMRLISKLADTIEDSREGVQSASRMARLLSEDYEKARQEIGGLLGQLRRLKEDFVAPLLKLVTIFGLVGKIVRRGSESKSEGS